MYLSDNFFIWRSLLYDNIAFIYRYIFSYSYQKPKIFNINCDKLKLIKFIHILRGRKHINYLCNLIHILYLLLIQSRNDIAQFLFFLKGLYAYFAKFDYQL